MCGREDPEFREVAEVDQVLRRGRDYQFLREVGPSPSPTGVADRPMNGTSFRAGSVNHLP